MSNVIKKIKIKQQDGTFTDYIPIGAEAENVNVDGESVEEKLNKMPYYYNSVADMKADESLKAGDMVITLGYYEANDGGGAEYCVVNGEYEDDGGSIHELSNGLFAELIINNEVSVKQFGAKGDDQHDDTQAIQNSIDYCSINNKYAKKVYIPYGIYQCDPLYLKQYTILEGDGWKSSFLKIKNGVTTNFLNITDDKANFCKIINLGILGNKDNNACPNGIYCSKTAQAYDPYDYPRRARDMWLEIRNVTITRVYGNGIGTASSNNNMRECRFDNIDINNCDGWGMAIAGSDNNYSFITCWGNAKGGIALWGSAERYSNCKAFANGDALNPEGPGWQIQGLGHQIIACEAQENAGHGFIFKAASKGNFLLRADANGTSDFGTSTHTHSGIYITEGVIFQRNNLIGVCSDFRHGSGDNYCQETGISLGDAIQCNIQIASTDCPISYYAYKPYIFSNSSYIQINGKVLSNVATDLQIVAPSLQLNKENEDTILDFGSSTGKKYRIFTRYNDGQSFRIDSYYDNQWKSNPFYINYDSTNTRDQMKIGAAESKLGFFGSWGATKQTAEADATDLASVIQLTNNLKTILKNYGLIS